jgi:ML domain
MRPRVRGTWLGITVDVIIPEDQQNACNHLEADANCPILADNIYDYQFTLAPASNDPLVTAEQEFTMLGDHDQVLFCYRIRNTVVNP